jgi:putative acetyltransferase
VTMPDAGHSPVSGVRVRPAELPGELVVVRALFQEYASWTGVDLEFQDFARELETLPGLYAPPAGRLLLAECEGVVAGCVALRPLEPGICEMKRLFVRDAFRGRSVGRALAIAIVGEGRRIGYPLMRLDTLPGMSRAIGLYERLGFREIPAYRFNPIEGTRYLELALDG